MGNDEVTARLKQLFADPERQRARRGRTKDWVDQTSDRCVYAKQLVLHVLELAKKAKVTEVEMNDVLGLDGSGKIITRVKKGEITRSELEPLIAAAEQAKVDLTNELTARKAAEAHVPSQGSIPKTTLGPYIQPQKG